MNRSITILACLASSLVAQTSGVRPAHLVIRNATVVDGNGTPARGPFDIVVEGNVITQLVPLDPVAARRGDGRRAQVAGATEIDATGKYVLPGLINAHAHLQAERSGTPQQIEYEWKIWLSCGSTPGRDVGS